MATTENVDASAQEGHRVYIGNLSFNATEEQVKEHLSVAGPTSTAIELPLRFGKRPGGFGFAVYDKEEDAKTVIEKLNGSEFDGRKIKLDLARSKEETDQRRAENNAKRDAARAAKDAAKAEKAAAAGDVTGTTGDTTAVTDGDGLVTDGEKKKKKKPSKKRAPRRRQPGEEGEEGTTTAAEGTDAAPTEGGVEGAEKPKPKRKTRKPKEARIDAVEGEDVVEGGAEKPKREKKPRAPRVRRQEPTGEPSKTTIFVANLPFDIDDAGLSAIFTNLSINVKSATVATRRVYSKNKEEKPARRSRGFGFVDVEDPSQQQEAVEKVEGTLVGERTITAKIANEMKDIEVEEAKDAGLESKVEEGVATSA